MADDAPVGLDELARERLEAAQADHEAKAPWLQPVPGEWLSEKPPKRDYLLVDDHDATDELGWRGVLVAGRVGLLTAPGGAGKSWALVQLAVSLATGVRWLGAKGLRVVKPGPVALVLGEEDAGEAHRRLFYAVKAARIASGDDRMRLLRENLRVAAMAGRTCHLLNFDGGRGVNAKAVRSTEGETLRAELASAGVEWRAVLLDPLSRFAGAADENDNGTATRIVQELEALAKMPGNPAVLVAHHERKGVDEDSGQAAARGASAFVDGVRWHARIVTEKPKSGAEGADSKANPVTKLHLVKSNYTKCDAWELGPANVEGEGAGAWEIVR